MALEQRLGIKGVIIDGRLRGVGCPRPVLVEYEEIRHAPDPLPFVETWVGTSLKESVDDLPGNRPINQAVPSVAIKEEKVFRTVEVYPVTTDMSDLLR